METLLMYMENHDRFDSAKVKESFRMMEDIVCISEADWIGDNLECVAADETHIRLSADQEVLAIQGSEKASIHYAFEIQKIYGGSFHLTDSQGQFDTIIDGSQDFQEICQQLLAS